MFASHTSHTFMTQSRLLNIKRAPHGTNLVYQIFIIDSYEHFPVYNLVLLYCTKYNLIHEMH